jgi:hypothetical protein
MHLSYEYVKGRNEIFNGEFEISRSLPYKGEVLVHNGEKVQIETVIARNLFNPPKIYMIDIRKQVGVEHKLTLEDIKTGLSVRKGDRIEYGQAVFSYKKKGDPVISHFYSNVRGEVVKIDDYGMIILKEIQDYGDEPITVNLAADMGIKPKEMEKYLKYHEGDFVQQGQIIAQRTTGSSVDDLIHSIFESRRDKHSAMTGSSGKHYSFKAPSTGYITKVDYKTGEITIQYKSNPFILRSFVIGEVTAVHKNLSADIKVSGSYAYCLIGFGGENYGKIKISNLNRGISESDKDNIIVFAQPVNIKILEDAVRCRVKGIIAPSINNRDWVEFSGREIGIAITGKEPIGFTFMLTEGFGSKEMNNDYIEYFKANEGRIASINGRTRVRAGVIRPRVLIS